MAMCLMKAMLYAETSHCIMDWHLVTEITPLSFDTKSHSKNRTFILTVVAL